MANIFPRWTNTLPLKLLVALVFIGGGVAVAMNYYFTPKYTRVGYQPNQPIPFSHQIHAGQLGVDCPVLPQLRGKRRPRERADGGYLLPLSPAREDEQPEHGEDQRGGGHGASPWSG